VEQLLFLAQLYSESGDYENAERCYTQAIDRAPPHWDFYSRRASVASNLLDFEQAIRDTRRAIELAPDNATLYWSLGGYILSNALVRHEAMLGTHDTRWADEVLNSYALSLEKDPSCAAAWLNLLEICVLLKRWDEAIGRYGACAPHITYRPFKLIRAYLGCLALSLSGEDVEAEDEACLLDENIRFDNSHYRFSEVEALLQELMLSGFDADRLAHAREIHRRFLCHFDGQPRHYYERITDVV